MSSFFNVTEILQVTKLRKSDFLNSEPTTNSWSKWVFIPTYLLQTAQPVGPDSHTKAAYQLCKWYVCGHEELVPGS